MQNLAAENHENVYYAALATQEIVGALKRLLGMETLVAKNMIALRRQYFSVYGEVSMGSSGTGSVYGEINKSRACAMNRPLAYADFSSCANDTIFTRVH